MSCGGKTLLSEAPGAKTGKCKTFGCVRRPPARRLARATCGCVRNPRALWFEGLVATKRKEAAPGKWSEGPLHSEWKWPPGACDLRAPQLRNKWTWPPGGGGLGNPQLPNKNYRSATQLRIYIPLHCFVLLALLCFACFSVLCPLLCIALLALLWFALLLIACIALHCRIEHCIACTAFLYFASLCFAQI